MFCGLLDNSDEVEVETIIWCLNLVNEWDVVKLWPLVWGFLMSGQNALNFVNWWPDSLQFFYDVATGVSDLNWQAEQIEITARPRGLFSSDLCKVKGWKEFETFDLFWLSMRKLVWDEQRYATSIQHDAGLGFSDHLVSNVLFPFRKSILYFCWQLHKKRWEMRPFCAEITSGFCFFGSNTHCFLTYFHGVGIFLQTVFFSEHNGFGIFEACAWVSAVSWPICAIKTFRAPWWVLSSLESRALWYSLLSRELLCQCECHQIAVENFDCKKHDIAMLHV